MKKTFKKFIACFIAVIMVLTSVPMNAFAAMASLTATLSVNAVGLVAAQDSRYADGAMNIVNDGETNNFTVGFWKYDLSGVKSVGGTVTEASMVATLANKNIESDTQGLSFYYATQNTDSLANGRNNLSFTANKDTAVSQYGLVHIMDVAKSDLSQGKQITVDMVEAINNSVSRDLSYCTIMVLQTNAGGTGSNGGWTDTWVNASNTAVNAKMDTSSDLTGTTKVAPAKIGMIMTSAANDEGRLNTSTKDMNIVNDGESSSFSVGFWQYGLDGLKQLNADVTSAALNITIPQASSSEAMGLTFYYATKGDGNLTDGFNAASTVLSGSVSTWQQNVIDAYGLVSFATISSTEARAFTAGQTITVDLAAALNESITLEKDNATIMVMQSTAGQTNKNGGWTDTHLGYDTTANTLNTVYNVKVEDLEPGVAGLMSAISAYEKKMTNVGTAAVPIYTNMPAAYQSYVEACAALDAYRYGSNSESIDLDTIAQNLVANTTKMTAWKDNVTGNYQSKIPTFTHSDATAMANLNASRTSKIYNNIIYTENCVGGNSDTSDGDTSGMAVQFDEASNTKVQVYHPNMILLFDGSSTGARFPVMFMGRKTWGGGSTKNKTRVVYSLYAGSNVSPNEFDRNENFVGASSDIYSMFWETGKNEDSWRGGDNSDKGFNRLDFDATFQNGGSYVGSTNGNPNGLYSADFGYSFWSGSYWNAYSAVFKVNPTIDMADIYGNTLGVKEVKPYWVWYGGSSTDSNTAKTFNAGEAMKGLKQSTKSIYVLNYKYLMDAVKNVNTQKKLSNVANYKEGGLADLINAFDTAINYSLDNITPANVAAKGQEILDDVDALKTMPVADVDTTNYSALITEFNTSKKLIDKGNEDNRNYTAETWAPFEAKYNEVVALFTGFYTDSNKKISTSTAETLKTELEEARKALVLNKVVVNTDTLQIVLDNALRLIALSNYFVDSTVSAVMEGYVNEAITKVWGSADNYGFDSDKIEDTEENRKLVEDYTNLILTEVNKAVLDIDTVVDSYGYSINTAIEAAAPYEATKDNYGNYATLASAVKDAQDFVANVPAVNGLVEGMVENLVNRYVSSVEGIGLAIATLRPAFSLIKDGTIAKKGEVVTTSLVSNTRPDEYKFGWTHNTNMVVFKRTKDPLTFNLPTSSYTSYNKATHSNFETVIDSITLSAQDVTSTGELTSITSVASGTGWPSGDYSLNATQIRNHAGNFKIQNNGVSIQQSNFKIASKSNANGVGFDRDGNRIYDEDYDFTDILSTTEGNGTSANRRPAGISALNGTTTFNATTTLTVNATTDTALGLSGAQNGPEKVSVQVNTAVTRTNLGILYTWRYLPTLAQSWAGYAFVKSLMDLNVGFVDVSTLFEKLDQLQSDEYIANQYTYTKTSWDALTKAIEEANSELDYDNLLGYEDIVNECQRRYNGLFTAERALKKCASNEKLRTALANTKDTYENKRSTVEPSTWDQFATAYTQALSAFNGKYSNTGIRDFDTTEQTNVDAIADALIEAYNNLHFLVDFTPVDNAVTALFAGMEDDKYSVASIQKVVEALDTLDYYNLSQEERLTHYDSDTAFVAGLKEEAEKIIPQLANLLVVSPVTTETLEAAKVTLRAAKNDPDAYDQDKITEALNKLTISKGVATVGRRVKGIIYETQAEADAAVTEALSSIQLLDYEVYRDGTKIGTYPFGTQVSVASEDASKVDWYYESTSPSAHTDTKFMTSDTELTFIVRGTTQLTTKKAQDSQTYKVTYVNGENAQPYAIDYVTAGSSINVGTLSNGSSADAPEIAYRTFSNYSINGETKSKGDAVTVNSDTVVVANYDLQADQGSYRVYVSNLTYVMNNYNIDIEDLSYNDEISFTRGNADGEGYYGVDCHFTVNGEERVIPEYGRDLTGVYVKNIPEVYAWLEVNADDLTQWIDDMENGAIMVDGNKYSANKASLTNAKIVGYGTDYKFRVSKPFTVLMALDEEAFNMLKGAEYEGFYDAENMADSNGALVTTQDQVVVVPNTKFSMVSQFVLPANATLVESGVLFTAKRGSTPASDLPLRVENAGVDGIVRVKSNAHTAANQYVISVRSSSLAGQTLDSLDLRWAAYMIYNINGTLYTVYSPETFPSNPTATL